jgi:hypothetical protein
VISLSLRYVAEPPVSIRRETFISTSARGPWMGNRGQLHESHKQLLGPFKLKAWLICLLEFNGLARQVMAPNRAGYQPQIAIPAETVW